MQFNCNQFAVCTGMFRLESSQSVILYTEWEKLNGFNSGDDNAFFSFS
jgi:hypothetical protein